MYVLGCRGVFVDGGLFEVVKVWKRLVLLVGFWERSKGFCFEWIEWGNAYGILCIVLSEVKC